MNEPPNRRYGVELLAFAEEMREYQQERLARLNRLAGPDGFERSRELVLFQEASTRSAVELVAPEIDEIVELVVEYRRLAGRDNPPPTPEPPPTKPPTPRFLSMADNGASIEPMNPTGPATTGDFDPDQASKTTAWPEGEGFADGGPYDGEDPPDVHT